MRTDDGWLPSTKELELINNVTNFCLIAYDLHLRFSIASQPQYEEKDKPPQNIRISRHKERLLRYPSFFECIEKYKMDEEHFLNEFHQFLQEYIGGTSLLKKVFNNFSAMLDKTVEEITMFSVREFLEPIVTNFLYKQTLELSHFKIVDEFILFLEGNGKEGNSSAEKIKNYTEEDKRDLFNSSHQWLTILLICFRKDRYNKPEKKKQLIPAIPRENIDKGLKRLFQAKTPIITLNDRRIDYFKEGDNQSLGFIPTDTEKYLNVHPSRIPLVKAGGEMFGSFMSHRLLQYESKIFYERWNDPNIRLNDNYSRIAIEGGYKELIHRMGSSPYGENIEQLKKLLYFQAHFLFTIPEQGGGCRIGNLIALEEKKNNFGKTEEIIITAGTMLTPEAVYKSKAVKGGRLLVPFVDLPEKMVGNPATWGSQAFLQMLVLEYLTMQSREFSENGSLLIPRKQWEQLAFDSQIPKSFMKRLTDIQELFCCPDQGFLEKQGDEYSFNKRNEKAKQHLIDQGKMREKRSKQARDKSKKNLKPPKKSIL